MDQKQNSELKCAICKPWKKLQHNIITLSFDWLSRKYKRFQENVKQDLQTAFRMINQRLANGVGSEPEIRPLEILSILSVQKASL